MIRATLDPLVPGNEYAMSLEYVSGDAYVPSDHRTQIVIDSPTGSTTEYRITKIYDPAGGSSSGMTADGDNVLLTLTPTETEAMAAWPGYWVVVASVGPAATQSLLVPSAFAVLHVYTPPGGAVPHV